MNTARIVEPEFDTGHEKSHQPPGEKNNQENSTAVTAGLLYRQLSKNRDPGLAVVLILIHQLVEKSDFHRSYLADFALLQ